MATSGTIPKAKKESLKESLWELAIGKLQSNDVTKNESVDQEMKKIKLLRQSSGSSVKSMMQQFEGKGTIENVEQFRLKVMTREQEYKQKALEAKMFMMSPGSRGRFEELLKKFKGKVKRQGVQPKTSFLTLYAKIQFFYGLRTTASSYNQYLRSQTEEQEDGNLVELPQLPDWSEWEQAILEVSRNENVAKEPIDLAQFKMAESDLHAEDISLLDFLENPESYRGQENAKPSFGNSRFSLNFMVKSGFGFLVSSGIGLLLGPTVGGKEVKRIRAEPEEQPCIQAQEQFCGGMPIEEEKDQQKQYKERFDMMSEGTRDRASSLLQQCMRQVKSKGVVEKTTFLTTFAKVQTCYGLLATAETCRHYLKTVEEPEVSIPPRKGSMDVEEWPEWEQAIQEVMDIKNILREPIDISHFGLDEELDEKDHALLKYLQSPEALCAEDMLNPECCPSEKILFTSKEAQKYQPMAAPWHDANQAHNFKSYAEPVAESSSKAPSTKKMKHKSSKWTWVAMVILILVIYFGLKMYEVRTTSTMMNVEKGPLIFNKVTRSLKGTRRTLIKFKGNALLWMRRLFWRKLFCKVLSHPDCKLQLESHS
mmetsp:Transcript_7921/g.10439  ORF Transcript_7921/g.10439 Transcript_7921/m.10439 type:complete len:594 (+) Transcript_7921:55-1836(+)